MKVALILNNLPPVIDGVGDYADLFASEISSRGIEVLLICRKGIDVRLTNPMIKAYPVVSKWNEEGFADALVILKEQKPQYVFFQFVPYAFNHWGIPWGLVEIVKSISGLGKICFVFHETYIRNAIWPLQTFFVSAMQRYILKKMSRYVEISITSIERYALQLRQIGFSNVHIVPIPANVQVAEISDERILTLKRKLSGNDEKLIVVLGNRDYRLLIQSFQNALQKRKDMKLIILGKQDMHIEKNNKNIYVTGVLSRQEIFEHLSASDLFISFDPVKNEKGGSSNKSGSLASALAAGLPVIGFKGDMNNDKLKQIPDFYLEEFDASAIEYTILEHINLPKSEKNKEFWKNNLSYNAAVDYYMKNIFN